MRSIKTGLATAASLQKVEKGNLVLKVPGVSETLRLPVAGLRSLVILTQAEMEPPAKDEWTGRLEIPGVRLAGKLVDAAEKPGASCLAWQPDLERDVERDCAGGLGAYRLQGAAAARPRPSKRRNSSRPCRSKGVSFNSCSVRRCKKRGRGRWRFAS